MEASASLVWYSSSAGVTFAVVFVLSFLYGQLLTEAQDESTSDEAEFLDWLCAAVSLFNFFRNLIDMDSLKSQFDVAISKSLLQVSAIGAVSHFSIAAKSLPTIINAFGRKVPLARMAEWSSTIYLIVSILEFLDVNQFSHTAVFVQAISGFAGCLSMIIPSKNAAILLNAVSWLFFLNLLVRLRTKMNRSMFCEAKNEEDRIRIDVSSSMTIICVILWTPFGIFNALGMLGLVSQEFENSYYAIMSVFLKCIYGPMLFRLHRTMERSEMHKEELNNTSKKLMRYTFHEIRAPLNAIVLGLDVFPIETKEKQQDLLNIMGNCATTMSKILEDTLILEKVESGKLKPVDEELRMGEFLHKFVSANFTNLANAVNKASVKYSIDLESELSKSIHASREYLEILLKAVLTWSLSRSPQDSSIVISASIGAKSRLQKDNSRSRRMRVSISNQGKKISKDERDALFDPFATFRTGEVHTSGESGLEIFIANEIAKKIGGSVEIDSRTLNGIIISVDIPVTDHSNESFESPVIPLKIRSLSAPLEPKFGNESLVTPLVTGRITSSPISSPSSSPRSTRSRTSSESEKTPKRSCLVVDDVKSNRLLTRKLMERMGFVVFEACDGKEAVEMVQNPPGSQEFAMICMDNMMPVMSGSEAAKAIRDLGKIVPIIGITGNALQEDIDDFIARGANIVLPKPIRMDVLENAVDTLLPLEEPKICST